MVFTTEGLLEVAIAKYHGKISWKQCALQNMVQNIMETMCPPGYHHNGFVTTHEFGT